ncbi:(-)-germacrene D synthase, partial [Frankliniella fusca]
MKKISIGNFQWQCSTVSISTNELLQALHLDLELFGNQERSSGNLQQDLSHKLRNMLKIHENIFHSVYSQT